MLLLSIQYLVGNEHEGYFLHFHALKLLLCWPDGGTAAEDMVDINTTTRWQHSFIQAMKLYQRATGDKKTLSDQMQTLVVSA